MLVHMTLKPYRPIDSSSLMAGLMTLELIVLFGNWAKELGQPKIWVGEKVTLRDHSRI